MTTTTTRKRQPQRFVRVSALASHTGQPLGWIAAECDRYGDVTRRLTPGTGPGRPTKHQAQADARTSNLPEYQP